MRSTTAARLGSGFFETFLFFPIEETRIFPSTLLRVMINGGFCRLCIPFVYNGIEDTVHNALKYCAS